MTTATEPIPYRLRIASDIELDRWARQRRFSARVLMVAALVLVILAPWLDWRFAGVALVLLGVATGFGKAYDAIDAVRLDRLENSADCPQDSPQPVEDVQGQARWSAIVDEIVAQARRQERREITVHEYAAARRRLTAELADVIGAP